MQEILYSPHFLLVGETAILMAQKLSEATHFGKIIWVLLKYSVDSHLSSRDMKHSKIRT